MVHLITLLVLSTEIWRQINIYLFETMTVCVAFTRPAVLFKTKQIKILPDFRKKLLRLILEAKHKTDYIKLH